MKIFAFAALVSLAGVATSAAADAPKDFIAEAKLIYRIVGCTGTDPLPASLDAKSIDAFCKWLKPKMDQSICMPPMSLFCSVRVSSPSPQESVSVISPP